MFDVPEGKVSAIRARILLAYPRKYLGYLIDMFKGMGGQFRYEKVDDLRGLTGSYRFVVNCTGLGARELLDDQGLKPWKGSVIRTQPIPGLTYCIIDDTVPDEPVYLIPRENDCLLGGTAYFDQENLDVSDEVCDSILKRCGNLFPNALTAEIIETYAGLRPQRPIPRIEQDSDTKFLFHNYGHGGSGYTISWGSADLVAGLVQRASEGG